MSPMNVCTYVKVAGAFLFLAGRCISAHSRGGPAYPSAGPSRACWERVQRETGLPDPGGSCRALRMSPGLWLSFRPGPPGGQDDEPRLPSGRQVGVSESPQEVAGILTDRSENRALGGREARTSDSSHRGLCMPPGALARSKRPTGCRDRAAQCQTVHLASSRKCGSPRHTHTAWETRHWGTHCFVRPL